jgi:hypothetical protein
MQTLLLLLLLLPGHAWHRLTSSEHAAQWC